MHHPSLLLANALVSLKERFIHFDNKSSNYRVHDYLSNALTNPSEHVRNWAERIMFVREHNISSLYEMADRYRIDREVISSAANIIDRCLCIWVPVIEQGVTSLPYELDVYCMVALWIAIKTQVGHTAGAVFPSISMLLPSYPKKLLKDAECDILYELKWNVLFPTPVSIVRELLPLLPCHWGFDTNDQAFSNYKRDVYREARYFTELTTLDYGCSGFCPTTIALAAVMAAIQSINRFTKNEAYHLNDPLSLFKEAVSNYLGDLGISCDQADVQQCSERIVFLSLCQHQDSDTWSTASPDQVADDLSSAPGTP
jgi:hypothetical protein